MADVYGLVAHQNNSLAPELKIKSKKSPQLVLHYIPAIEGAMPG
jgi:hypothetical protein